jgi:hypothetical protein
MRDTERCDGVIEMFGKKKPQEICSFCDHPVKAGQKVCSCGQATRHMDFSERAEYEVEQWRAYRAQAATG